MTYSLFPDNITLVPLTSQHALGWNYGGFESTFDDLSLANLSLANVFNRIARLTMMLSKEMYKESEINTAFPSY